MKSFTWLFTLLGVAVASLLAWRWYKRRTFVKDPSARNKEDLAADVQSANRDIQRAQTVTAPGVLTPKASWVRINGGMIDLNRLGGSIPPLVTSPVLSPWQ
jgi:hypothetical protein